MSALRNDVRTSSQQESIVVDGNQLANFARQRTQCVRSTGDDAFTLIELLIVIVVLGILAAVVVLSLGSVNHTARQLACNNDAITIETAVRAYNAQTTTSKIGVEVLGAGPGQIVLGDPTSYGAATQAQLLVSNNYMRSWPAGLSSSGYAMSMSTTTAGDVAIYIPPTTTSTGVDFESENTTTGCYDPSL